MRGSTWTSRKYLARSRDSPAHAGIDHKREALLAARDDPHLAIETAADYAAQNLARLRRENLPGIGDLGQLDATAVARYAYVMHLVGPTDGISLLRDGTVAGGQERAARLLANQFPGGEQSNQFIRRMRDANGDAQVAFRNFVVEHTERHVK